MDKRSAGPPAKKLRQTLLSFSKEVSSWIQTSTDVTIILHAGRPLKTNDISVEFTRSDVKVGLTDGRKWSCQFWQPIAEQKCKVQLRKMKIHLIVSKSVPGVTWDRLEVDGAAGGGGRSNVVGSSQPKSFEVLNTKSAPLAESRKTVDQATGRLATSDGIKPLAASCNDSEVPCRSKSDIVRTACDSKNLNKKETMTTHCVSNMAGDSVVLERASASDPILGSNTDMANFSVSSAEFTTPPRSLGSDPDVVIDGQHGEISVDSSEESVKLQCSVQPHFAEEMDSVRASQGCADLTSSVCSMDLECVAAPAGEILVLPTVNHNFYENSETMVIEIYVKNIVRASLEVSFKPTGLKIIFQTSDLKFCELHAVTSTETRFSWSIELADAVNENRCKYKLMSTKVEITLMKLKAKMWGSLKSLSARANHTVQDVQSAVESSACGIKRSEAAPTSSLSNKQPLLEHDQQKFHMLTKPTCRVAPLSSETSAHGVEGIGPGPDSRQMESTGGWTGLDNLGNTCFMNSVLQVLVNTAELKAYFIGGHYQKDINTVNPLGMKGDMAKSFDQLVVALWNGTHGSFSPSKIKTLLAMKQTRFTGYLQHDAEEFMEFLLDGLHEDLNRIIVKPYSEQEPDYSGKTEKVSAEEQWKKHLERNDSHIVDTFMGQFRSKLMCPVCHTVSVKFDPFSVISVPIPNKKKLLKVIFMPRSLQNKPVKYQLLLDSSARIQTVKDTLYQKTRVHPNMLRIMEVRNSRVVGIFDKDFRISHLDEKSQIIAFEVLSSQLVGKPVRELVVQQSSALPLQVRDDCSYCGAKQGTGVALKRCMRCYRSAYCNQACQIEDWKQHKLACKRCRDAVGCPFIVSLPVMQITYRNLYEMLDSYARYSINTFQPPRRSCGDEKEISASTVSASQSFSSSCDSANVEPGPGLTLEAMDTSDCDQTSDKAVRLVIGTQQNPVPVLSKPPFTVEIGPIATGNDASKLERSTLIDKGDELCDLSQISHLEMVWNNNDRSDCSVMVETRPWDSLAETTERPELAEFNQPIRLQDCLQLFCEPELLGADQTWKCPQCKLHCRATKELSVWRMPKNLIIQIKRFSFGNIMFRNKIDSLVDFPLRGLNMGTYFKSVATDEYEIGDREDCLYDLYGVINHYGGMLGGHYTSFARTPDLNDPEKNELGWRQFDDDNVSAIGESSVVSRAAYVLFYRRRDVNVIYHSERAPSTGLSSVVADTKLDSPLKKFEPDAPSVKSLDVRDLTTSNTDYACQWTDMEAVD